MINLLKAAGRSAVLAQLPGTMPFGGATDVRIQQYNQVIVELYNDSSNGITVPPPDFRTYFMAHTNEYLQRRHHLHGDGVPAHGGAVAGCHRRTIARSDPSRP